MPVTAPTAREKLPLAYDSVAERHQYSSDLTETTGIGLVFAQSRVAIVWQDFQRLLDTPAAST